MIGRQIGNYRIVTELGAGAMGEVYFAEHSVMGRRAAIKVIREELSGNVEMVERFANEARLVNRVGHPNIVEITDFGQVESRYYIMMELLEGETLEERLERARRLPSDAVNRIAVQITQALGAAHDLGVVHRDLKPENIFLVNRGGSHDFVKLLDFGIAKLMSAPRAEGTVPGMVLGTPHYMSPEQCHGAEHLDHRSDVYSLGVILYRMVTGSLPFESDTVIGVLHAQANLPPRPPRELCPELSDEMEATLMKALAKAPEDRFQNMAEFRAAIEGRAVSVPAPKPVAEAGDTAAQANAGAAAKSGPQAHAAAAAKQDPQAHAAAAAKQDPQAHAAAAAKQDPQAHAAATAKQDPQAHAAAAAKQDPQAHAAATAAKSGPQAHAAAAAKSGPQAHAAAAAKSGPQAHAATAAKSGPQAHAAAAAKPVASPTPRAAEKTAARAAPARANPAGETMADAAHATDRAPPIEPVTDERKDADARVGQRVGDRLARILVERIHKNKLLLPAMPASVRECLRLIDDPEGGLVRVAHAIGQDPLIAPLVVRRARSALLGTQTPVRTIEQAVSRLGARQLRLVLMDLCTRRLFESRDPAIRRATRGLWDHSRAVALVARGIARRRRDVDPDAAYLAGLLHDVGKPVAASLLLDTERTLDVKQSEWLGKDVWLDVIKECHREVGVALARSWELPAEIVLAIALSQRYSVDGPGCVASVVCLANALVKSEGIYTGECDTDAVQALVREGLELFKIDGSKLEVVLAELAEKDPNGAPASG